MSLLLLIPLSFLPLTDSIRISDTLVLDAEYLPAGEVVETEGMILKLEDFILLKGEIEISGHSCDTRIRYVQDLALKELEVLTVKKDSKINRLELLHTKNKKTHLNMLKKLEKKDNLATFYKVSAGILLGSNIFLSLFLILK